MNRFEKSTKWPSHKKLESDAHRNCSVTWCSYSAEIKLQYMKNIFQVAHFHINMVLSTRNMFKDAHVIKSRGALGTGFTYAPVLLFELLPSDKLKLYESLFEREEHFHSTSHYSPSRKISALRNIILHWEYRCSTSYLSNRR